MLVCFCVTVRMRHSGSTNGRGVWISFSETGKVKKVKKEEERNTNCVGMFMNSANTSWFRTTLRVNRLRTTGLGGKKRTSKQTVELVKVKWCPVGMISWLIETLRFRLPPSFPDSLLPFLVVAPRRSLRSSETTVVCFSVLCDVTTKQSTVLRFEHDTVEWRRSVSQHAACRDPQPAGGCEYQSGGKTSRFESSLYFLRIVVLFFYVFCLSFVCPTSRYQFMVTRFFFFACGDPWYVSRRRPWQSVLLWKETSWKRALGEIGNSSALARWHHSVIRQGVQWKRNFCRHGGVTSLADAFCVYQREWWCPSTANHCYQWRAFAPSSKQINQQAPIKQIFAQGCCAEHARRARSYHKVYGSDRKLLVDTAIRSFEKLNQLWIPSAVCRKRWICLQTRWMQSTTIRLRRSGLWCANM